MPHRILIVEKHPDTRDLIAYILRGAGFTVAQAGSLVAARTLLGAQRFDAVVLDTRLPDGSGLDLCREIGALLPQAPVVFCSGYAGAADRQAGLDAGATAYLIKPDAPIQITAVLAQALASAERAATLRN